MSYEPTNWKDGDLVTSAKLNKMEQGIAAGSGILVVHMNESGRLDRTWQEIYDADLVVIQTRENNNKAAVLVRGVMHDDNTYDVWVQVNGTDSFFSTSAPNDYPIIHEETGGGD